MLFWSCKTYTGKHSGRTPTTCLPTVRTLHWTSLNISWGCPCTMSSKLNKFEDVLGSRCTGRSKFNMSEEAEYLGPLQRGPPCEQNDRQTELNKCITFLQLLWLAATRQCVTLTFIMFTRQENFITYFQRRIAFYSYPENCMSKIMLLLWLRHLQLSVQNRVRHLRVRFGVFERG